MPVIAVTMAPTSEKTRKELIQGLTEKAVEITNIPKQAFLITISELPETSLGCGGQTIEEMKKAL
ncbi:MAG: 4-oxalocrotonate tautomerase [Desulfobulbaceae bacterium]|nr:MAG: 4-oxalocrotonate tautomerase [Desulfobulbaceae bacterium]